MLHKVQFNQQHANSYLVPCLRGGINAAATVEYVAMCPYLDTGRKYKPQGAMDCMHFDAAQHEAKNGALAFAMVQRSTGMMKVPVALGWAGQAGTERHRLGQDN